MEWMLLGAALLLAFVNGANDNFKGVATLYGSGALSYRRSLAVATLSTAAGSLASLTLAAGLVHAFSGKGIIPNELLDPALLCSVALAAAATVLLATRLGYPISTTHALVGGIAGAGLVRAGSELAVGALGSAFLLPLLAGPLLAVGLAWLALVLAQRAARLRAERSGAASAAGVGAAGVPGAARMLRGGHVVSASLVGFARGLNDTPKLLGLIAGVALVSPMEATVAITATMAAGGLLAARPVAQTLSRRITPMSPGQGLAGNLATAFLVLFASRLGVPVSTTHVSTGALFGIGGAHGSLHWPVVREIAAAWLTTLPIAALLGALLMWGQRWA